MTTANVQVGFGMSYSDLKKKHYEVAQQSSKTRMQEDYDFLIHEHVILHETAYNDLQMKQQKMIEERDAKYEKRREYKKMDKTIDNYFKRKNENPKVQHKQANNFAVIFTASNLEDYNELVTELDSNLRLRDGNFWLRDDTKGVSEKRIRKAHVLALKKSVEDFNQLQEFGTYKGLLIDEYYVHANEDGVPHLHCRMLLDDVDRHGNPNGNFAKKLQSIYGVERPKDAMEKFRKDIDKIIMDNLRSELYKEFGVEKKLDVDADSQKQPFDLLSDDTLFHKPILKYTTLVRKKVVFESQQE
ncbi:hypothetical protein, partial [Tuanshanicoccus yangjingiae]|uniref:hypothetical protein n=1 Tax=Aerococcaceae bacterium zg-252 TaxID=2796928 RepID=UPI0040636831